MNLANKITFARLLLIPAFMLFASVPIANYPDFGTLSIYIATGIFMLAAFTDKLDGYIARKYKQITRLGIFLDPLADKLLITAALICLVPMGRVSFWIALVIIGREFAVTLFRLSAVQRGLVLPADRWGKYKMVLQVIAVIAVLLDNFPFSLITSAGVDDFIMYLAAVITIYSGVNYLKTNWDVFSEADDSDKNEKESANST